MTQQTGNQRAGYHQGHKARKRFGQNFLVDQNVLAAIVQAIGACPEQPIIEIGPGLGAISDHLIAAKALVTLIELDRDLAQRLEAKHAASITNKQCQLIVGDVLKVNFPQLIEQWSQRCAITSPVKLVGNLPYNISTPVLFHLLEDKHCFSSMLFMLQKELVDRLEAPAATSAYSALSVVMQLECHVERLFDVPSSAFEPAPKVESSVVQLTPNDRLANLPGEPKHFRQFVHHCFNQRRKTLRNNLKGRLDEAAIRSLDIDPQLRPEHLEAEQFLSLFTLWTSVAAQQG